MHIKNEIEQKSERRNCNDEAGQIAKKEPGSLGLFTYAMDFNLELVTYEEHEAMRLFWPCSSHLQGRGTAQQGRTARGACTSKENKAEGLPQLAWQDLEDETGERGRGKINRVSRVQ